MQNNFIKFIAITCFSLTCVIHAQELTRSVTDMTNPSVLNLEGEGTVIDDGPNGEKAMIFPDDFSGKIALPKDINPHDYDLLKIEIRTDAHARLQFSLENFPLPGQTGNYYVLDTARGEIPWRTLFLDFHAPEEVMPPGVRKGMTTEEAASGITHLRFSGNVPYLKRSIQESGRSISIGKIRFVKKAVDIDWDQTKAPYTWESGKDLIYTYPLTISNKLAKPVTALVRLAPFQVKDAQSKLSEEKISLGPKESKTIQASISLPADIASKAEPLYCERFEVFASAEGIPDSEVTLLSGPDIIHLPVVVPIPESKLAFPLLGRRKDLPEFVHGLGKGLDPLKKAAELVKPDDLNGALNGPLDTKDLSAKQTGFSSWGSPKKDPWPEPAERYKEGLDACGYLYDLTGEKKYLDKGTALLLRAAELWGPREKEWREAPERLLVHGIFGRAALALGWVTGSNRSPYFAQNHGFFNDFDLMAKDMDPASRQKILDGFILPAGVRMRNVYVGLGNQQDVPAYPIMYAGLACRNWPLVAFAHSSEHGLINQLKWGFDDEGLCVEANYQQETCRPILWMVELLYHMGIDLYDQRLYTILHSPGAEAIKKPYKDSFLAYADSNRFAGKNFKLEKPHDGAHLISGTTSLRWKGWEVGMNWGSQLNRSAPDRCALFVQFPPANAPSSNNENKGGAKGGKDKGGRQNKEGKEGRQRAMAIGGGNYIHSSLGQSIIIIDESLQNPKPAKVTGYQIDGSVQFVQAVSDEHYPGTTINRTFALVENCVLAIDRVQSTQERIIDWCLNSQSMPLTDLSMKEMPGGFTTKPRDTAHGANFGDRVVGNKHQILDIDTTWKQGGGLVTMLGEKGTQVLTFAVGATYSAGKTREGSEGTPVLMCRRKGVKNTDFISAIGGVNSLERVPVTKADGNPANAIGVRVAAKDGKTFNAIVNYEPEGVEVALGGFKTKERFATDYK